MSKWFESGKLRIATNEFIPEKNGEGKPYHVLAKNPPSIEEQFDEWNKKRMEDLMDQFLNEFKFKMTGPPPFPYTTQGS